MSGLSNTVGQSWAFMKLYKAQSFTRLRILQTPWVSIYLHKFITADDPVLHDHPFSFISFILHGGYTEQLSYNPVVIKHKRFINCKRAEDAHFIKSLDKAPTWTLFIAGKRRRKWGYIDKDGSWRHNNGGLGRRAHL